MLDIYLPLTFPFSSLWTLFRLFMKFSALYEVSMRTVFTSSKLFTSVNSKGTVFPQRRNENSWNGIICANFNIRKRPGALLWCALLDISMPWQFFSGKRNYLHDFIQGLRQRIKFINLWTQSPPGYYIQNAIIDFGTEQAFVSWHLVHYHSACELQQTKQLRQKVRTTVDRFVELTLCSSGGCENNFQQWSKFFTACNCRGT